MRAESEVKFDSSFLIQFRARAELPIRYATGPSIAARQHAGNGEHQRGGRMAAERTPCARQTEYRCSPLPCWCSPPIWLPSAMPSVSDRAALRQRCHRAETPSGRRETKREPPAMADAQRRPHTSVVATGKRTDRGSTSSPHTQRPLPLHRGKDADTSASCVCVVGPANHHSATPPYSTTNVAAFAVVVFFVVCFRRVKRE